MLPCISKTSVLLAALLLVLLVDAIGTSSSSAPLEAARRAGILEWHNVNWVDDGSAQIPLGNGDVTAGVWISNTTGDLRLLISSSSAFDENSQPVKIGVLRITLDPPIVHVPATISSGGDDEDVVLQIFDPTTASFRILTRKDYEIDVYVDANAPLVRVSVTSHNKEANFSVSAAIEPYRRFGPTQLGVDRYNCNKKRFDHYDTVVDTKDLPEKLQSTVTWYHENPQNTSYFQETMSQQGINDTDGLPDPFLGRIFGGALYGSNMTPSSSTVLKGANLDHVIIQAAILTQWPSDPKTWIQGMVDLVSANAVSRRHVARQQQEHKNVWEQLWNRSCVALSPRGNDTIDGGVHAEHKNSSVVDLINAHLVWDRYLTLIQGRKASTPLKFNGQTFTANDTGKGFDYRDWGSGYWWQNTRQPYYNSLIQGDVDVLDSMVEFYTKLLPYVQARTFVQFQDTDRPLPRGAALYPETTTQFGTYLSGNWGCDGQAKRPYGASANMFIRFHWTGGLELSLMLFDRYEWTRDKEALKRHMPVIQSIVLAFMARFPPNDDTGIVDMFPAQSLETWQCPSPSNRSNCVTGPTPDIAGLLAVLKRAVALPDDLVSDHQRQVWANYIQALPEIPSSLNATTNETIILPAQHFFSYTNFENTELYTVHPFRLYGVGKKGLATAQSTYRHRRFPCNDGWCQDIIHAAMLNVTGEVVSQIEERAINGSASNFRFPGFADHFQDYQPSLDHFSTLTIAVNAMLLAPLDDGSGSFILFPGFPSEQWDVEFRLHGPYKTTIDAKCSGGELVYLHVDPPEEAWRVHGVGNCRVKGKTKAANGHARIGRIHIGYKST